jgi:hypothetical protein
MLPAGSRPRRSVPAYKGVPYPPPPHPEPLWPGALAMVAAIALQVSLPERLSVGPGWLAPAAEGVLLIALALFLRPVTLEHRPGRRRAALTLIALVSAANVASLALLSHYLLHTHVANGHELILSGMVIWLTNVLIFALWYWELDRGGPGKRAAGHAEEPDFLFSQMGDALPYVPDDWSPNFVDYLYLSFTAATAFSPTDVLPISSWSKILMGAQGLVSLVTLGLIISRAVNILA